MKGENLGYKVLGIIVMVVLLSQAYARAPYFSYLGAYDVDDSTVTSKKDAVKKAPPTIFPGEDPFGRLPKQEDHGGIHLRRPSNIQSELEFVPEEQGYYLYERLGDDFIRNPYYIKFDDYSKYRQQDAERNYWQRRLDALTMFNRKPDMPEMSREGLFDRIFGGTGISVKPTGNVDIRLGGKWQYLENPLLRRRDQRNGFFDFDIQMNMSLVAAIGEKMKLNINNNTKSTMDNQNIQKLEYAGKEDEILKKVEAGNVNFNLNSNLIRGVQSVFGLKTQMQFGKLWVTTALGQQKSQRKSQTIQNGGTTQSFSIKADEYEENKHFFLAQYFRNNYNQALSEYPLVNSIVNITKIEVWVTNKQGATTNVRDVLAFMDLGEKEPYNSTLIGSRQPNYADNRSNRLYDYLQQNPSTRTNNANSALLAMGLQEPVDFQRTTARLLNSTEYSVHPTLGYVSLNFTPNPDDVIGVAYQFTVNGDVFQVGEFSDQIAPDSTSQKVLFLKMLKGTAPRPQLPVWQLMMKNVYALGGFGLTKDRFRLNLLYRDPGGGEKRYIPEGDINGIPLVSVLNLDRLNAQGDPSPDGSYDYVEGITINSQQGKIIFPVLEPFGKDLAQAFNGNAQLINKYTYQVLYDSTKTIARQFQQKNRFVLSGEYTSTSSSDIFLGGFNIPQGSVSVNAGGQQLIEGTDYTVDYSLGRIRIINAGILSSGMPINVQYEDNATFGFQQQNFTGLRLDYNFSPHLTLGGTYMKLKEQPFTQKTTVGEDPINNTVLGLDVNYQNEWKGLTRVLDKLPVYSTTAPSFVSASAEVAGIFPGHSKIINGLDPEGSVYLDDFEGTRGSIDLRTPYTAWTIASTPFGATGSNGEILFPEASLDSVYAGMNRAHLAWYNIDATLLSPAGGIPDFVKNDVNQHYIRQVAQQDLFPAKSRNNMINSLLTLDLAYYPTERGAYNFDATNINADGELLNPEKRWGGIMRPVDNSDFEAANVEFIEFWLLDPFINNPNSSGGKLYFNLGNVSEDVMKDGMKFFENGIPYPFDSTKLLRTPWGVVPIFQQQIVRAFDINTEARNRQDVGLDGMDNLEERAHFQNYLDQIASSFGVNSRAYEKAMEDPSNDDFLFYRNAVYAQNQAPIIQRYKYNTKPQGNSPVSNDSGVNASTNIPDGEDINRDNTLNQSEEYYQYRINISPSELQEGKNFIVSKQTPLVKLPNGETATETWYQFKIPIREYEKAVGNISDFRSIRFMRMFLTGFTDSVILRFGKLELGRNQWRTYLNSLKTPGGNIPPDENLNTEFNVLTMSLEENSSRDPIPYVMPPGLERQRQATSNNQTIQLNEQSISLQLCGLRDGDARAVYKEVGVDLRQFDKMRMFIHAESRLNKTEIRDGELRAFIRIGSDYTDNYYEYQVPLYITPYGTSTREGVWPEQNRVDFKLEDLVSTKSERNAAGLPSYIPYSKLDEKGNNMVVVGNPSIGDAKVFMLGVLNPQKQIGDLSDDGLDKCIEVWFNELRVTGMNEKAAYAAAGSMNVQLADLGAVKLSGNMHTLGYGNIDQSLNERFRDEYYQYSGSTNLNLGKMFPRNWGVQLPAYIGYSESISNPEFDPYDTDIRLRDKLRSINDPRVRDSVRRAAQDYTGITSFNFTNVRFTGNPDKQKKIKPWSLPNFDFTYAYNKVSNRDPLMEMDDRIDEKIGLGYVYSIKTKTYEPFKKLIKSKSKWWALVKDFNITPLPTNFTFRNDLNKIFQESVVRHIGDPTYKIDPIYYKFFTWTRTYGLRWELTKSLAFDYAAKNISYIDEPFGRVDTKEKSDTLWNSIKRLGRNANFNQTFTTSYTLPTNKIPLLDWTNLRGSYSSGYTWTAASLATRSLGHTLANTNTKTINGDLNFKQLYAKQRVLKAIDTYRPKRAVTPNSRNVPGRGKDGKDELGKLEAGPKEGMGVEKEEKPAPERKLTKAELKKKQQAEKVYEDSVLKAQIAGLTDVQVDSFMRVHDSIKAAQLKIKKAEEKKARKLARQQKRNRPVGLTPTEAFFGKLILSPKRFTLAYTETGATILPGYMDSTNILGMNWNNYNPGFRYTMGYQPDYMWFNNLANAGYLSTDSIFNQQLQQTYSQNLNLSGQLEPITDLRVDLTLTKTFSKSSRELLKDTDGDGVFEHLNPYAGGSFNISYWGIKTMFQEGGINSSLFRQFINNGVIISDRLGKINPYVNGARDPENPNYAKGYTKFSQDVLIPSFLAAYTKKPAEEIELINYQNNHVRENPFKYFKPKPNWRLNYSGLAKLPMFADILQNAVISHGYTGTLSMNSFSTALFYADVFNVGAPSFIDSVTGNFVPFYTVPNITMMDQLNPLLSIDATFKNALSTKFEMRRTRTVAMSMNDYQIAETKSQEYVFGLGYRIKGLNLPFQIGNIRRLENDLNFKFDFGLRDDKSTSIYFAQEIEQITRGAKVYTFSATIDYIISDKVKIQLYADHQRNRPYTSQAYNIHNTRAGLLLQYIFTQ